MSLFDISLRSPALSCIFFEENSCASSLKIFRVRMIIRSSFSDSFLGRPLLKSLLLVACSPVRGASWHGGIYSALRICSRISSPIGSSWHHAAGEGFWEAEMFSPQSAVCFFLSFWPFLATDLTLPRCNPSQTIAVIIENSNVGCENLFENLLPVKDECYHLRTTAIRSFE